MTRPDRQPDPDPLGENIETISRLREQIQQREDSLLHRPVEGLFASLARPITLYVILLLQLAWILFNTLGHLRGFSFDAPPFFWLQGLTGGLSLSTTIVVLIVQARQGQRQERREQLQLQINLLAEQKTAKIIQMLEELRRDLPNVRDRLDPEAEAMGRATHPETVMRALGDLEEPEPEEETREPAAG